MNPESGADLVRPLHAVVFATVSPDGLWIDVNAGVADLCGRPPVPGQDASWFFMAIICYLTEIGRSVKVRNDRPVF